MVRICFFILLSLEVVACGKVGDPVPRQTNPALSIQDLRVSRQTDRVSLSFSLPGSPVQSVEIYRQCSPKGAQDQIQVIARLEREELKEDQPGIFAYDDRSSAQQGICRYALRFLDASGRRSEFSNFAEVSLEPAYRP